MIGAVWLTVSGAQAASVSATAYRISAALDSMGVTHKWLPDTPVDWKTGEPVGMRLTGRHQTLTHCGSFVMAFLHHVGLPFIPDDVPASDRSGNYEISWLNNSGSAYGWRRLDGPVEAQKAANAGEVVLEGTIGDHGGHIAVVRPSTKSEALILQEGPQEAQAGGFNSASVATAVGVEYHPGAWAPGGRGSIQYFAHLAR